MIRSPAPDRDMGATLSRNAQVLKFFAQQYRSIPRKRLVKLAYMADVIARQYLGRPISSLQYRADYYGPYSPEITDAIEELVSKEFAWTRETEPTPEGIVWKRLFDSGRRIVLEFSLGEIEILDYVAANYLKMPMKELLEDVVYETSPWKARDRFREPLHMDLVDEEGKRLVGFDLEAIIKAELQAEAGDYTTAREFFDGLRAHLTARYAE